MSNAVAKKEDHGINAMLTKMMPEIKRALPRHLSPDRMARIALTEFRKNPGLQECDMLSFLGAIVNCSQLGLEPGGALGHVYLIPFKNRKRNCKEVQVIIGYRGLIELARRSGLVVSIAPRAVFENDTFEYEYGLDERCYHVPTVGDAGELTHAYAVVKFKDGEKDFEVMTRAEIEKVRDGLKYPNEVWADHFEEMVKKTVIRRIVKRLPLSPELSQATAIDDSYGKQSNHQVFGGDSDPVFLDAEVTTPSQVNAEIRAENDQSLRDHTLAKIQAHIANELQSGRVHSDLETQLGIPFDDIPNCSLDQLTAIWDSLN